ncbi:uncharacterized protein TrAtP1_010051 [Trichoderma atroviride]|uniref:uncharacterized protein n=1 Tax=Hypocrea atroviridis TaxID=63577 RepID=UPI003330904E|nr:hypothetical protein TrAtP1_010051 [Trichoderma atroviride]
MEGKQDTESEHGANHWPTIESSMYYLDQVPLYNIEKPYSMRYLPEEDIPQSNYVKVKRPISARSMREPGAGPFRIEECGFQMIDIHSHLTYDEFWDNERVQSVYIPEVKKALKLELGAKYVHVLDYAVRKRHESFPVSTGKEYQYDQPTALAHIDFTAKEGERIIRVLFGDRAEEVLKGRWQAVNVWKPIKGPLDDWPLGLCDARSVDFANDTIPGDIVFDDFVTENLQIFPSPNFQWYYVPDQSTWEALMFKSADSDETAVPGCPHSGFYNPHAREGNLRES